MKIAGGLLSQPPCIPPEPWNFSRAFFLFAFLNRIFDFLVLH